MIFSEEYGECTKCEQNPNCHYKQLKCKEQECDTLKSQLDFAVQQKECLEQEYKDLKKYLIDIFKALDIDTKQSLLGSNCIEFYAIRSSTTENKIKQYKQIIGEIENLKMHQKIKRAKLPRKFKKWYKKNFKIYPVEIVMEFSSSKNASI